MNIRVFARWLAISSLLLLSACHFSATRQCPAFYHPEFANWVPTETEGEEIIFSSNNGDTVLFVVGSLVANEAFATEGYGTSEKDISCRLKANRFYTPSAPYPQIAFEYLHADWTTSSIEDESLLLTLKFKTDEGKWLPQRFYIYHEANSERDGISGNYEYKYSPRIVIDKDEYNNVISSTVVGTGLLDPKVTPDKNIVRVMVARGIGLLQLELADGRVFTRNL